MELIDIIIFTLKLFALTATIVVLLSYFIFKVKDRTRVKPYMRPTKIEPAPIEIKVKDENEIPNPVNNRFRILNNNEPLLQVKPVRIENPKHANKFNVIEYKGSRRLIEDEFNIFNYYSNRSFEPMHKIKT